MYIVANKGIISGYLSTRFTVSRSPIRNAVSFYDRFSVLPNFANYHVVPKNYRLTTVVSINCSPGKTKLRGIELDLDQIYDAHVESLVRVLALRDIETEAHTRRVATMVQELARIWGMPAAEIVHIRRGALLHDIGKVGAPDHILRKEVPLTEVERAVISRHQVVAYELLFPISYFRPALDIPYCHHEKWDGTGYPRGQKGDQIPFTARLFAVIDTWDALLSDRPYRLAWPVEQTRDYMIAQSGKSFEPEVVGTFLGAIDTAGGIAFCQTASKSPSLVIPDLLG
jgi:putative nucleotidyltransferase with HDIG domain